MARPARSKVPGTVPPPGGLAGLSQTEANSVSPDPTFRGFEAPVKLSWCSPELSDDWRSRLPEKGAGLVSALFQVSPPSLDSDAPAGAASSTQTVVPGGGGDGAAVTAPKNRPLT